MRMGWTRDGLGINGLCILKGSAIKGRGGQYTPLVSMSAFPGSRWSLQVLVTMWKAGVFGTREGGVLLHALFSSCGPGALVGGLGASMLLKERGGTACVIVFS